jgi:hypothetical protein
VSRALMAKRLSRLERAYRRPTQTERERILARLSLLTPVERQERIKILAERVLQARGIDPAIGEDRVSAAVRILRQSEPHSRI